VYSGLQFDSDVAPDPGQWDEKRLDYRAVAAALEDGRVVAWVQGRWEMGPRALGNRSLLASPFEAGTRDRLNTIKGREGFRPIAPACRIEDAGRAFDETFVDPHMLYTRRVVYRELNAVTHADGTARAQIVTEAGNRPFHELLTAFSEIAGIGVLCNTSLNHKGCGFINRTSDLLVFCDLAGVDDFVIADSWFTRRSISSR
jgi:hydroxymethyl cephem carbamoyltransferase